MQPLRQDTLIQMVLGRLERISADSIWSHRASGIRGSLLRLAEQQELGQRFDPDDVNRSLAEALRILTKAAQRNTPTLVVGMKVRKRR